MLSALYNAEQKTQQKNVYGGNIFRRGLSAFSNRKVVAMEREELGMELAARIVAMPTLSLPYRF